MTATEMQFPTYKFITQRVLHDVLLKEKLTTPNDIVIGIVDDRTGMEYGFVNPAPGSNFVKNTSDQEISDLKEADGLHDSAFAIQQTADSSEVFQDGQSNVMERFHEYCNALPKGAAKTAIRKAIDEIALSLDDVSETSEHLEQEILISSVNESEGL